MVQSKSEAHQPSCMLAHDMINRLTVILGFCDLLKEHTTADEQGLKYLSSIRFSANSMAEELKHRYCQPDPPIKSPSESHAVPAVRSRRRA